MWLIIRREGKLDRDSWRRGIYVGVKVKSWELAVADEKGIRKVSNIRGMPFGE